MDDLITKRIKQKHASRVLGISVRQVRRLKKRYKQDGAKGLIHLLRGRRGNREINQEIKDKAIDLVRKYYPDFGPTLALEKLVKHHGTTFGVDTLRKEMIAEALWQAKTRKMKKIHPYRERRACLGELVQLDGSPHDWFEGRCPPCTLVAFIDDATGRIMDGEFVDYEGTFTLFGATEHYLQTHGRPLAFYVDKHSTFKINRQASVEEELKDQQAQSQFSRAMDELNIEVVFANSPQAKGRVERLFETLQDRLVKEMRLAQITTKEKGTKFFREVYLPLHNSKFAVSPREKANLHKPILPTYDLNKIFTIQSKRLVSKDLIIRYKNTRYQLLPPPGYRYTLRQAQVAVEERQNDTVVFRYKDETIPSAVAIQKVHQQKTPLVVSSKEFKEERIRVPGWNHPWRQARRLAITRARERHERESGNNQVMTVV